MKTMLSLVPDSAIPGIVALIGLAGAIVALATCSGCAGLEIVTRTPYGDAAYRDGTATLTPTVPLKIPVFPEK